MKRFSLIVLLVVISFSAFAVNKHVIEQKLKNLNKTLEEKRVNYKKIKQQYQDLMVQIKNTDNQIRYLTAKINRAQKSLKTLDNRIKQLNLDIGKVSAKLLGQRQLLEKELKSYYEYSLVSPYYNKGVWFNYMNGYVTSYIQNNIESYINKKTYLKNRMEQLNSLKKQKISLINDIEAQKSALKQQKDKLNALAIMAEKKKQEYMAEIQRIAQQQQKLKDLLNRIIEEEKKRAMLEKKKRLKAKKINPKLVAKEFSALSKKIPPPVKGRLISRFGKKYDPVFKVYTRNDGIDIEAKKGACVKSIAYGKVDYVGDLPGYGGVVIINHLNGYYTVYGGVKSMVKVGDVVKAYQCFARLQFNKLHFEIRRHATPLNPLNFIDRRLLE